MYKFLFIALGGAAGALLRYSVSGASYKYMGGLLPCGTLVVNLAGCFAIGFLWQAFEFLTSSPNMRAFIFVGILGAFTTFSTYGLETYNLFREGELKYALLNIAASNILGLGLVFAGFIAARYLFSVLR
ncbi:MAG: fluoride efflux transporter CrcB [Deltaproteobacteria bacterium]